MATNLDIEPALLEDAMVAGSHRSKKAAVTEALREYIARHKQQKIIELFGKVDFAKDYDYKKMRKRS